jgi:hypothetical protein
VTPVWLSPIFHGKNRGCRLFLGRGVTVSIPSAALQFEATGGDDFFGLIMALRALNGFGIHADQLLGKVATFALKFINRHLMFLSQSAKAVVLLAVIRFGANLVPI